MSDLQNYLKQMYRNNQSKFLFEDLKEEHIDQATILLTNTFVQQNPIWFNINVKKTEAYEVFRQRVKRGLAFGGSKVVIDTETGKLAMVLIYFDVYDYLHTDFKLPMKYKWQIPFANNAKQLQTQYLKELNPKRGQYVFGDLSGTNKQYSKNGVSMHFWLQGLRLRKQQGFKATIFRTTNPIVAKMVHKIGAEFIKTSSIQFEDGKSFQTSLMILRYDKFHFGKSGILPSL